MRGEQIPPPRNASPGFSNIILKACAFDSRARYTSLREMLVDLDRGDIQMQAPQNYPPPAAQAPVQTMYAGAPAQNVQQPKNAYYHETVNNAAPNGGYYGGRGGASMRGNYSGGSVYQPGGIPPQNGGYPINPNAYPSGAAVKPKRDTATYVIITIIAIAMAVVAGAIIYMLVKQDSGGGTDSHSPIGGSDIVDTVVLESETDTSELSDEETLEPKEETEPSTEPTAPTAPPTDPIEYDSNRIAIPSSYKEKYTPCAARDGYCNVSGSSGITVYRSAGTSEAQGEAYKLYEWNPVTIYGEVNGYYYAGTPDSGGTESMCYIPTKYITAGSVPESHNNRSYTASEGYMCFSSCSIRSSPSKANKSNIIGGVYQYTPFHIQSFDGYWYYVSYPGGSGYVSYKMMMLGSLPNRISDTQLYTAEEAVIRSSPKKASDNKVETIPEGTLVTATHDNGEYYFVTYAGGEGYVSHKEVTREMPTEAPTTVQTEPPTTVASGVYGYVESEIGEVRSSPNEVDDSTLLAQLSMGDSVTIIGEEGDWYLIEWYGAPGNVGYIAKRSVSKN